MRGWTVVSGPAGRELRLYKFGLRNSLKQRLHDTVDFVDAKLLDHWLCGNGVPEFVWAIPVGRPKRGEDGLIDNSVGALLYNSYGAFLEWVSSTEERDLQVAIPISKEEADVLFPPFWEVDEDEDAV